MGKRICQFGVEHGRCRCMCPDKEIACDVPEEHGKRDPKEPTDPIVKPTGGVIIR